MTLHDLFAIPLFEHPERTALRFRTGEEPETRMSYRELLAHAERLAALFAARGVGRGDRVAFFLGNRPEFVTAYLAVLRLGAVMVPLNLAYRRPEIAHVLTDAEPVLLVTEEEQLATLDELPAAERGGLSEVVTVEELEDAEAPEPPAAPRVEGSDLALLLYTSGTTGRSKGARLTHDNLLATVTGLLAAWGWRGDDELLLTLPLFHTHGLVVGLTTALAAGACVRLHPKFDAARVVHALASGEPTLFFGVPTLYVRLVRQLEEREPRPDLSSVRLFCSGSAPLAPETFEAFERLSGHRILERYGMTETGMLLSSLYAGARLPGTVGVPLPGVSMRIVGETLVEVADGEEGEIVVRGANVFDGYWKAPEKTGQSFLVDDAGRRWFQTGDLARRDPETGHVTLLGRLHELILTGGYNVYPREVEEALLGFPGVREAAVVGRAHPELGEVPVAFLVSEGEIDGDEMIAWLKERLAGFKVPRRFERLTALPKNALGKVQKHLLPR